jgi:hypothetical protein
VAGVLEWQRPEMQIFRFAQDDSFCGFFASLMMPASN